MNLLVPLTLTDAMLTSCTAPETDYTVWAFGTFAVGDMRMMTTGVHRIYECLSAHTSTDATGAPNLNLSGSTPKWLDRGATNRWLAFDGITNTPTVIATPLTWVLRPGFFNAVAFYDLDGASLTVSVKDAPGGTVVDTRTVDLQEPPIDWYEWLFSPITARRKVVLTGFVPYPDAELTITITAASGNVGCGQISIGDYRPLIGDAEWGGTLQGAAAEPFTYSYIKTDGFGRTEIKRRHSATNLSVRVAMPRESADLALASVQEVLDVPACWIATDTSGYAGLNVYGLGSGSVTYDDPPLTATFTLNVRGFI